jgi:uncharacterized protein (TIGR02147 family)
MRSDIGDILKNEYSYRKKGNPKYSLRAFSRDMKMSPGFLSEVLKNKKKVSIDKAMQISSALGWSWRQSQVFLQTTQLGHAKSKKAQKFLKSELQKSEALYGEFDRLKLSKFSSISNWYYMAVLELTEVPEFRADASWIARALGIEKNQAEDALEKLKVAGLLIQDENLKLKKKANMSLPDTSSSDIRKFHRQHLTNAANAIEEQEMDKRHFSGVTMAIDPSKLPEALTLIREFRSRMASLLESGTKQSVYHLAVQLYQLDHKKETQR